MPRSIKTCVRNAERTLNNLLHTLRHRPYRVALVGEAGSGKSSLINRVVGQYVAEIGVIETTSDADEYPTPYAPITLVDLPGYGTQARPTQRFVHDQNLTQYDAVLLLYSARVKSDDVAIFQELKSLNIPCYVVRNSIDIALEGERARTDKPPRTYAELLEEITDDARQQFHAPTLHIYAVAAHPDRPEFALPELLDALQRASQAYITQRIEHTLHTLEDDWTHLSRIRRIRLLTRLTAHTITTPVPGTRRTLGVFVSAYALGR